MTFRDTYLTIDLDYWHLTHDRLGCNSFINEVLNYCKKHKISKKYIHHHHEILNKINNSVHAMFNKNIVNVDFHSDFGNGVFNQYTGEVLGINNSINEGSWAQNVSWNNKDEYIWMYPDDECLSKGICYGIGYEPDPFEDPHFLNGKRLRSIRDCQVLISTG
jgi:hypothetical protein